MSLVQHTTHRQPLGRGVALALALIVMLGLGLRLYGLEARGLKYDNEATYYFSPKATVHIIAWSNSRSFERSDFSSEKRASLVQFLDENDVYPVSNYYYKPLYLVLLSAFQMVAPNVGYRGLLYWSAFFGAATVLPLFFLARLIWDDDLAALAASFFLAVSGFHILWSRNGYSQATTLFFLCLTLVAYISYLQRPDDTSKRYLGWLAGLGLGATFALHPSSAPYLAVVGIIAVYSFARKAEWKALLSHFVPLVGGTLILLIFLEALLVSFQFVLGDNLSWLFADRRPFMTFYQQIFGVLGRSISPLGFFEALRSKISAYGIQPFLYGEGLPVSALVVAGTLIAVRRWWKERRPEELLVFLGLGFPVLFFFALTSSLPYPRNVAFASIFVALLAGLAVAEAIRRWHPWPTALVTILITFLLVQGAHIAYLYQIPYGYQDAAGWLKEQGEKRVLTHQRLSLWEVHGIKAYSPLVGKDENINGAVLLKRWDKMRNVSWQELPSYYAISESQYRRPELVAFTVKYIPDQDPVAIFPNTDPFTAKRFEMLRIAQKACGLLAFICPEERVQSALKISKQVVWNNAVKLYRLPTNNVKVHPHK